MAVLGGTGCRDRDYPALAARAREAFPGGRPGDRDAERSAQKKRVETGRRYFPDSVLRLLTTLWTPLTPLAAMPATFLSISFATTPSSVTSPFFTMMWIGGTAPIW